jgi:parallel beta-helix repeat protein
MKYCVMIIGIFFFFVSCNPNNTPSPTPTGTMLPPSTGDWVITSNILIEDKSLVLNGNIQIKSGGQLSLRRTQLAMSNQFGINVESSGGITIENETVIKPINDTGRFTFVVRSGARIVMRDSEILGCGWGIPYQAFNDENTGLFIYADNAVLERNLFSNNFTANRFTKNTWSGVCLWNSENSDIGDNTFEDGNNGIMAVKDFNNVITGNIFSRLSEGGLILFYSRNNEIRGNTFTIDSPTRVGWAGIALLKVSRNTRILNNSFIGGKDGVVILHSLNNTIEGNTFDGSWNGFQVHYSNGNLFANNSLANIGIGNCPYGGIFLNQSSDNKIFNNRIGVGGREPGVVLMGSSLRNTLAGNVIHAGFRGLMLHGASNNNSIQYNSFSAEMEEAVVIDQSSGNIIHHNNFKGNKRGYDNGANSWDDGSAGNFWGLFAGGNFTSFHPRARTGIPGPIRLTSPPSMFRL